MEPIYIQGRRLSGDDLAQIRALLAEPPDGPRPALSLHLSQLWDWRNGAGRLKDMAARTLRLKLQARGWIEPVLNPVTTDGHSAAQPQLKMENGEWQMTDGKWPIQRR